MFKLLASDFDNTLAYKWKIPGDNVKSIKKLQGSGIDFALVSGRPYSNIKHIFKKYGLDGHIIANNGAIVCDRTKGLICDFPMDKEEVRKLIDICLREKWIFLFYSMDTCFLPGGPLQRFLHKILAGLVKKITGVGLKSFYPDKDLSDYPDFYKMNIYAPGPKADELRDRINQEGKLSATRSGYKMIEIMNAGVNKWEGLSCLIDDLGLSVEETAAIGDYDNDVEMLKHAGLSFAVANASPTAKEAGKMSVGGVREGGFGQAVDILLEKRREA